MHMALKHAELAPLWELMQVVIQAARLLEKSAAEKQPVSALLGKIERLRGHSAELVQECTVRIQDTFITAIDSKVMLYLLFYLYKLLRSLLCAAQFLLSEQRLGISDLTRYLVWLCGYVDKVVTRCERSFRLVCQNKTCKLETVFDISEGEKLSLRACRYLSGKEDFRQTAVLAMLRQCENTAYDIDVFTIEHSLYE